MNQYRKIKLHRKLAAGLLAGLLCLSASADALAAEDQASSVPANPASDVSIEEHTESAVELYGPTEESPESVAEPTEDTGELLESAAPLLESSPLLVTGGHNTYLSGYSGGLFQPDRPMTRAETAQMLYNLLADKPSVSSSKFSDVSLSAWYGTAVNALAEAEVFAGYKDGTFAPDDTITRAEFVTALSKCFTLPEGTCSFTDVPENSWFYPYISAIAAQGWISGTGSGAFEPNRSIKRCEAVAVMNAALDRLDDEFAAERDVQKFKDVPNTHWAYLHVTEAAAPVSGETETSESEFQVGEYVQVTASGLNLRSKPTTGSTVITVLSRGTVLTITDISTMPWLGVKTSSNQTGYVSSEYVTSYTPSSSVGGASVSNSSLSLRQYQSARLDGSITSGSLSVMTWTSSDSSVAVVGYTLNYNGETQGAMVYGMKPGTATLTFADAAGKSKATCTVTVTDPEAVRFAYASENSAVKSESFDLVAVTDSSRTSVTFEIISGPADGSYTASTYTEESRNSSHGLPTNTVRVFKKSVSFGIAGTYTLRATAAGNSDYQEFQVFVKEKDESVTATSFEERRCSTQGLNVIANFEGSVPEIEDDSIANGNPTVGYGYVVPKGGTFYNNLTQTELFALLVEKVNNGGYTAAVNRFRKNNSLKMSQAQFDALVSFVYNCGTGALDASEYNMPKVMLNVVQPPSDMSESKSYSGVLNIGAAVMYEEASRTSSTVSTVPNGAKVTVIGFSYSSTKQQLWYRINYNSKIGWIPAGYISLDASGLVHDLAYADTTSLGNNFLQWHKSGGNCIWGLLARRMAECKIFFFGNYAEAYHSNANYYNNTYDFNFPTCCKEYE